MVEAWGTAPQSCMSFNSLQRYKYYLTTNTQICQPKVNISMDIFQIQKIAQNKKLDHEFEHALQEQYYIQKTAEYRIRQIRKDVNMLAGISVNGVTLAAFYILSAIMFQKIYDITGGTPLIVF